MYVATGPIYQASPLGNNLPLQYPAVDIQPGDLALYHYSQATANIPHDQSANGLTNLFRHSSTNDTVQPGVYLGYKICDGSEDGTTHTITGYNSNTTGGISIFRGVDAPNIVVGPWTQITSGNTITFQAVTMPSPGGTLFYIAAHNSTGSTLSPPAGYTEVMDRSTGLRSAGAGYDDGFAAGSSGTPVATWSGSARSMGVLIAMPDVVVAPADTDNFFQFL